MVVSYCQYEHITCKGTHLYDITCMDSQTRNGMDPTTGERLRMLYRRQCYYVLT